MPSLLRHVERPQEPANAEPAPQGTALVPAGPTALGTPRKKRPGSWHRLARYVSELTGDFQAVIAVAFDVVKDPEAEPKDRIKAAEFLAKWVEANPATIRHVVSGPNGKPISHAHAHVVKILPPDLTNLSDAELDAFERLARKAAGESVAAPVIDIDVTE